MQIQYAHSPLRNFIITWLTLLIVVLLSPLDSASQIKLAWDPETDPNVIGYKVYYGTDSRNYGIPINVGNVTTYTMNGLAQGVTYYIAVTAYDTANNESDYSNEVYGMIIETVSTPNVLSGPGSGITGESYSYTTGGSTSSLGHPVEYQFDWKGDGSDLSPWGSNTQSKTWTTAGQYYVRTHARCTVDSVVSGWSGGLSVTISIPLSVTVTASPPSPTTTGTSITFNATATGLVTPQYKFYWRDPSGVWHVGQDYSAASSWTWNTTGLAVGNYPIQIWARSAGSTAAYEAVAGRSYTLTNPPVKSVTLTATPASPKPVGTSITFKATATGGVTPQYQFYWRDPSGVWHVGQDYSAASSWTWNTTGLAVGNYSIQIWARSAGSTAAYEAVAGRSYKLTNPPITSVTLTATPASPKPVGTSITFKAAATGGVTPQYKFYWRDQSGVWHVGQNYSATSSWTWNTTGLAAGNYSIQIWARSAGSKATYEAVAAMIYVLN